MTIRIRLHTVMVAASILTAVIFLPGCQGPDPRKEDEPRVVFSDQHGRAGELADFEGYTGPVSYEILWGHEPVPEAVRFHDLGREQGSRGEHVEALRYFEKANRVDPLWAYPLYDAAYTYLLMGEAPTAEMFYARVDSMEPEGFFTVKAAVDCLRRERETILKPGMYLATIQLGFIDDRNVVQRELESMIELSPAFPVAWEMLSRLLPTEEERLEAIAKGLSYDPDAETRGSLLLNQGLILARRGEMARGKKILTDLANAKDTTIQNRAMAEIALLGLK